MPASSELSSPRSIKLAHQLSVISADIPDVQLQEEGTLVRMIGIKLEAEGCQAPIGSRCQVITDEGQSVEAEVVGFSDGSLFLMPEANLGGIKLGARVVPLHKASVVAVDESLFSRRAGHYRQAPGDLAP